MTIDQQMDDDARALAELGYTQELHRGMSGFSNFAVSFSIISILAGCITSYGIALRSGGPSTLVLGWLAADQQSVSDQQNVSDQPNVSDQAGNRG